MKKYQYILVALFVGVLTTSCNLDFAPSDELNADVLLQSESGAQYVVDGCYAMLKDEQEFIGYASGNYYLRHYFQMTEFQADNCCLSGVTTDPLYEAYALKMTDNLKNVGTLWWIAYKVAYMANTVIETVKEGSGSDQVLGEAYFLRALMHFHLVTMFAKPYVCGTENMGVVLRVSTNTNETKRATVGECYNQIVADLVKASTLLTVEGRGNGGYAKRNTALGLLSRVYLYMGEDQKVIDTVNGMLGGADPSSVLDTDYGTYFINAPTSKETLLCIVQTAIETKGQSSIGSMFLNDGMGWGEIYPSDPLLNLYERYPQDVRYTAFCLPQAVEGSTKIQINFPIFNQDDASGRPNMLLTATKSGENYNYTYEDAGGVTHQGVVTPKLVNGEYTEYETMYEGEKRPVRVHTQLKNRYNYPIWYMSKFSYQDGDPMNSSPVLLRWGEVILNRAMAEARLSQDQKAIDDVNVIRKRAGLTGDALFATTKMHGYTSVLDVVMDERRLELAFEGHRAFDIMINKGKIDRRFPGCQPWEVVNYDDNRLQNPIPYSEYSVSGIPQNPGY